MKPASTALRRSLVSVVLAVVPGLGLVSVVHAAESDALERRLEQSVRLIEALSSRLEQVERELATLRATVGAAATTPPAASATATATARLDEVEKTVGQLAASNGRDLRDAGISLHGFADVGLLQARHAPPGRRDGFALGSLDFYLTPDFGGNVKTLVELNFGVQADGETHADIERAQIGYTFSDALTLWIGRFHTPVGYWNMAFHHGAQIQTSILRPRLLDFEDDGGILPVHTTGAWATGGLRVGPGRLVYNMYAGNGSRIAGGRLDPNPAGDDNGSRMLGFGLNYRLGGELDGLAFGVHGSRQTVGAYAADGALTSRTRVGLFGGHVVYDNDGWELIGEYHRLRNTDLGGGGGHHGSWASYVHVGHAVQEHWMPYYRFEKASLDQADNYFAALDGGRSYTRHVLGLRLNTDPRAAVKLELNRTREPGSVQAVEELRFQYAVSF